MINLRRKVGESIVIFVPGLDDPIVIVKKPDRKIGVAAPQSVKILRGELCESWGLPASARAGEPGALATGVSP